MNQVEENWILDKIFENIIDAEKHLSKLLSQSNIYEVKIVPDEENFKYKVFYLKD